MHSDFSFTHDKVVCHVTIDRVALTTEEAASMWWQSEEANSFKSRAKRAAKVYQTSEVASDSYSEKFKEALDICTNSSGQLENVPLVSNSPARGLENYIFPELVQQRKRVIRAVLNAQRKLPRGLSVDHRSKLLNATSKHLTRPSRRLARLLAIGDAKVVAEMDFVL